ncbi:MAG: lipoyl synthase [Methanomassiliicoccus sp.]|nr:lipoyl synthase [Methanomassiliicoccus sp.]
MSLENKPEWLRVRAPTGEGFVRLRALTRAREIRTVCDSSHCPNISDCWSRGHATFMILGERCTRNCRFCAVGHGRPDVVDGGEIERIAAAVRDLGLRYVVITSVTRDDLPDQGAGHFSAVVDAVRRHSPGTGIELLIPDMRACRDDIRTVAEAGPDVLGHNIETVERLQWVRDRRSSYGRSLDALRAIKEVSPGMITKSSLMLGLGETIGEVRMTLVDLREAGVEAIAIGQYIKPRNCDLEVREYVRPEVFRSLGQEAKVMGFRHVASAPLMRSSFNAHTLFDSGNEDHVDR